MVNVHRLMLLPLALALGACEPYRIERRELPDYYFTAAGGYTPGAVELQDGTVLVYERKARKEAERDPNAKPFQMREEHEDGSVTLRALLPEHVIANTAQCLQKEEYSLLFEQLVAERYKREFETVEAAAAAFERWCRTYRREALVTLNRMLVGMAGRDIMLENAPEGLLRCRLRPQVRGDFAFSQVYIDSEPEGLKLFAIR